MKYRKKPVVIEAVRYLTPEDHKLIADWVMDGCSLSDGPQRAITQIYEDGTFKIHTPEGDMTAVVGCYIIKGVAGEFYPCDPDIFDKTYEKVE